MELASQGLQAPLVIYSTQNEYDEVKSRAHLKAMNLVMVTVENLPEALEFARSARKNELFTGDRPRRIYALESVLYNSFSDTQKYEVLGAFLPIFRFDK